MTDVERFFRLDGRFVWFCAALVAVWLALQYIINQRITAHASIVATQIYNWNWPALAIRSSFAVKEVKVLKRGSSEATIEVLGKQTMVRDLEKNTQAPGSKFVQQQCNTYICKNCKAILTFYKLSNNWVLGRADLR